MIGKDEVSPTVMIPEEGLLSEPVFLKDRVILKTGIVGWPLGTCVQFAWKGDTRKGIIVSRMMDLDNADGPWESQLEVIYGDY